MDNTLSENQNIYDEVVSKLQITVCVLSAFTSLLTVLVIATSFKRLLTQVHYKYILHSSVLFALAYISFFIYRYDRDIIVHMSQFLGSFTFVLLMVNMIVITLMSVDFLLATYYTSKYTDFKIIANWILGISYLSALIVLGLLLMMLHQNYRPLIIIIIFVVAIIVATCIPGLLTYIIVLIIFFVCRRRRPEVQVKTYVPLIFAGISFLACCSKFTVFTYPIFVHTSAWENKLTPIILIITHSYPILSFVIICLIDSNFSRSLIAFIKCKCFAPTEDEERTYTSLRYVVKEQDTDRVDV